MVKKKAAARKKLMPEKEITVKSRAYGTHIRAARGSKTPVGLNEAFAEHNRKTVAINGTAKRVHDLLKQCSKLFKETMLWQVMLSRMRKAASVEVMDLLAALKGLDLNSKYLLGRFAHPFVSSVEWSKKSCVVVLHGSQPHIRGSDTQYCYQMFLLTFGKKAEDDGLVSELSEWMNKEEKGDDMKFAFAVPSNVVYYVVCLHFMTGEKGKDTRTLASRGMKIVEVGKGNFSLGKKPQAL